MEKYEPVIDQLNAGISQFNEFLNPQHQLPLISQQDKTTYSSAMHMPWGQQEWPSKDEPGVYILCDRHIEDSSRIGIYIGKSSQQQIGRRVYAHLTPHRETGVYKRGNFIIDTILAIPISNHRSRSLAVALEEFLIARGVPGVEMLNAVGIRNDSL